MKDVRGQFTFRSWSTGAYSYKEAKGELGVPGKVLTHRIVSAQTKLSEDTGEHAGHLIGIQFGAPGDERNLGLQNPNMNTFAPKILQNAFQGSGGSYHHLESLWKKLLHEGKRIMVTITDKYRQGENRPFSRAVEWSEAGPKGAFGEKRFLEFGNFGSPQSREKMGQ